MSILDDVKKIEVTYDENDKRTVKCFCGEVCKVSLLPHLKKEHPEKWQLWQRDFVRLKNEGWSYKRIMWRYRAIFTWSVIDREIRKIVQEKGLSLKPLKKTGFEEWNPSIPLERTTVWDFRQRGKWAVHTSDYRGNWPPQIPRNLILKHTMENELVLDPFVGGGTTLIEAYLLKRKSIGIDLNPEAIEFSEEKIKEMECMAEGKHALSLDCKPFLIEGDANQSVEVLEKLGFIKGSIDLICTHPPYMDSIIYSDKEADLSNIKDVEEYCQKMGEIAEKLFILLKEGGICSILIGDVKKKSKIVPLGFKVMNQFLEKGFLLKEIIIKIQHQDQSTRFYETKDLDQYLLKHEYLFVFQK
jgi:16S rRNA G966 N2-methylase RsmD